MRRDFMGDPSIGLSTPVEHIPEAAVKPTLVVGLVVMALNVFIGYVHVIAAKSINLLFETKPCAFLLVKPSSFSKLHLLAQSFLILDRCRIRSRPRGRHRHPEAAIVDASKQLSFLCLRTSPYHYL